ncbi:hypothetical protein TIFTF001_036992 [Ficus carica]|nr:hypothetical protein TIFTF001_036978 [Ficus carica]GMN67933.1 hypothetical protein TIFTF001_036992 [Ficus carica]
MENVIWSVGEVLKEPKSLAVNRANTFPKAAILELVLGNFNKDHGEASENTVDEGYRGQGVGTNNVVPKSLEQSFLPLFYNHSSDGLSFGKEMRKGAVVDSFVAGIGIKIRFGVQASSDIIGGSLCYFHHTVLHFLVALLVPTFTVKLVKCRIALAVSSQLLCTLSTL